MAFLVSFMIEVVHYTYTVSFEEQEAIQYLAKEPIGIRLDLHGVLDSLPPTVQLPEKTVAISFVGPNTHQVAIQEIQARIQTKQIAYGVLVFQRGRGKDANRYVAPGGKAWVNCHIPFDGTCLFVDDSKDHLRSTQFLVPSITCKRISSGNSTELLELLQAWSRPF